MLDKFHDKQYISKADVVNVVTEVISALNLGNCIHDDTSQEGEIMPSSYKETYHYRDHGEEVSIRLSGKSKVDTDIKFQDFIIRHFSSPHQQDTAKSKITVDQFINNTYRESFINCLSPNCIQNYEDYIKRYISPFLGNMNMADVTVADIQKFMDFLAKGEENGFKKNISSKTIERVCGLCSRIFRVANEMNLISDTPFKMALLHNNGEKSRHHQAIPDDVVDRVKKEVPHMPNVRERLYMGFLVFTGLRREEILGLHWEDIHMDNPESCYGEVQHTVVYPSKSEPILSDNCKSESSRRSFVIPNVLVEILTPFKSQHGLIFYGDTPNKPISYATFKRMCSSAFKRLNITEYNNHDWRATYATQLKEYGLTSAQVSDMMGHADTRMVETVYARTRHESVMKNKNAVETLNKQYSSVSQ